MIDFNVLKELQICVTCNVVFMPLDEERENFDWYDCQRCQLKKGTET